MKFKTPLIRAHLERRYKRFLADVTLADGSTHVAHCPNPGAMTGLKEQGLPIWLEPNDDPRKKLKYGWRLAELPDGHWAGIDTSLPNRIVEEALRAGHIAELAQYSNIRPEVKYGTKSRVDFLATGEGLPDAYTEVKNVHLCRAPGVAEFPDSVTARGAKHLDELSAMVSAGHRAVMIYLVQRTDCSTFKLADDIDPHYAARAQAAREAGVEMICYDTDISTETITLNQPIPVNLPP